METLLNFIPVIGPLLSPLVGQVLEVAQEKPEYVAYGSSAFATLIELGLRKVPSKTRLSLLLSLKGIVSYARVALQVIEEFLAILDSSIDGVKLLKQNIKKRD